MNELDTFRRLQPLTDTLDPATADRVWQELVDHHPGLLSSRSATSNDVAESGPDDAEHDDVPSPDGVDDRSSSLVTGPGGRPGDIGGAPSVMRPSRWRFAATGLAAAAAIAGVVAVAGVVDRSGDVRSPASRPDATAERSPTPTPARVATTAPLPQVSSSVDQDALVGAVGFRLPGLIPDGWEITALSAGRADDLFGRTVWAKLDADGVVTGTFGVRPLAPAGTFGLDDALDDSDETVRGGRPAVTYESEQDRVGVSWIEAGFDVTVETRSIPRDEVLSLVESLELDAGAATMTFPAGGAALGLVPEDGLGFVGEDVVQSSVALDPIGATDRGALFAQVTPNTFGRPADDFLTPIDEWTEQAVDGLRLLTTTRGDASGGVTIVNYVADGFHVRVVGQLEPAEVIEFATTLRAVSATEFADEGFLLRERRFEWTELDRVTFEDGVEVTVRSERDGSGANAICIEAPVRACRHQVSEDSLTTGFADNVFDAFDVDGRIVMVGWQSTSEADRLGVPTLSAQDSLSNPGGETWSGRLDQLATTEIGRFIEVVVPDGELPPQLAFRNGDQLLSTASADLPGPFDF